MTARQPIFSMLIVVLTLWMTLSTLGTPGIRLRLPFPAVAADTSLPELVNIGAVFEKGDEQLLSSLVQAADRINANRIILPRTRLNVTAFLVDPDDSFGAAKLACKLVQQRIWALFSSRSEPINWFVRSLGDQLQVPHLSISWNYRSAFLYNVNTNTEAAEELARLLRYDESLAEAEQANNLKELPSENQNLNHLGRNSDHNTRLPASLEWVDSVYGSNGIHSGVINLNQPKMSNSNSNGNHSQSGGTTNYFGSNSQRLQSLNSQNRDYFHRSRRLTPPPPEAHYTVNLYPEANQLSQAFMEFVNSRNWKSFTLIYDDTEGLIRLKDLLRISTIRSSVKITVIRFPSGESTSLKKKKRNVMESANDPKPQQPQQSPPDTSDYIYRKLLKEIKKAEHNFVLAISPERTLNFLRQAAMASRMSEYDNFLIASLDIHRLDLSEFHSKVTNITGLTMLSSSGQDDFELGQGHSYRSRFYGPQPNSNQNNNQNNNKVQEYLNQRVHQITTQEALIYDAITLFARSLDDLDRSLNPDDIQDPSMLSCDSPGQKWPFGAHLVHYMKRFKMTGITGPIKFDPRGHRVNFTLDVMQMRPEGLRNVARWDKENGVVSLANFTFYDSYRQILDAMKYKEFKVTVPNKSVPYIYLKDNADQLQGNDRFQGFGVDLLEAIAKVFREEFKSDFKYTISVVKDGTYGRPNAEGEWSGMLGELIRHQADLAFADLSATYMREKVVDFTMPFMNLGIAILFKKPAVPDPELFSFLKPLLPEVWLYLGSAFMGISIMFWILSRISPYEWEAAHSCDPNPLELENQFSIGNSLWFAIGSLMQQGSDLAPKALSTRTLAAVWWFFTLIMISSYTANLAASLTLSRMSPAISNVEDLAMQTTILYGCKKGGSTYEFFQNSNHTTYQRMFNTMEASPEVYIDTIEEAIDRIRKGGYAYLAESSTIEYLVQRSCDLYQVGNWLDNKGYGIATPTDSPYRTPISNAIVVLQDKGILYELKTRWWVINGGGLCADEPKESAELKFENVGGVFVVLMCGVGCGCFFGVVEFIWKSLKVARDERESIGKLIWLEIVRICTGGGSSRPVYQAQASAGTTTSNNPNSPTAPSSGNDPNLTLTTTLPTHSNGSIPAGLNQLNRNSASYASMMNQLGQGQQKENPQHQPQSIPRRGGGNNYQDPYRYPSSIVSSPMSPLPPPPVLPSYDSGSLAPLLSPSSAPGGRFNVGPPPAGFRSPTAYSNVMY